MTERDMLEDYVKARKDKEELEEKLKTAESILFNAEDRLVNALIDKRSVSTNNYEGLGRFTLLKPSIQAYYDKERQEEVFSFVKKEGSEALIKETIHHVSFSVFIKAIIAQGRHPPEAVGYSWKESVRLNKWKNKGEDNGDNT